MPYLARALPLLWVDALFMEIHETPDEPERWPEYMPLAACRFPTAGG